MHYLDFLKVIHEKRYEIYFEIGSCSGDSLCLSKSPSVAVDPYYQLNKDPVGEKDFCLLFQETSDHFFRKTLPNFPNFECELGFIDGMHLFEYSLRDFINLAKISADSSLFIFHDPLPWSYEMATRDYNSLPQGSAWTGDIWKLIPILIDIGMQENMNVLTSAPSGLLTIFNPKKELIAKLEKNFKKICTKWKSIELNSYGLTNLYQNNVFEKPENYFQFLENKSFGKEHASFSKRWVSH